LNDGQGRVALVHLALESEDEVSADRLRTEISGLDERIIRRRVRDRLSRLKLELGPEALAGIRGMEEQIMQKIAAEGNTAMNTPPDVSHPAGEDSVEI
jgi:hypothetical protein